MKYIFLSKKGVKVSEKSFIDNINKIYLEPMLTQRDVAKILSVHSQTVYRWRQKGEGPKFFKVGKKSFCLKEDFFAWIETKWIE